MHVGTEIAALKASFSGLNNLSWQVLSSTELIELRIPTTINWLSEVTLFHFLNLYYRVSQRNASQEMERNWPTAQLLAATGSAWLVLSFPPFPVRRFVDWPGIKAQTFMESLFLLWERDNADHPGGPKRGWTWLSPPALVPGYWNWPAH